MGINLEYMTLLQLLKKDGQLSGGTVIEFGAQDISADHKDMALHAKRFTHATNIPEAITTAKDLYNVIGYGPYQAIDASGEYGAHVFDLNLDIQSKYGFKEEFDLVTNLGTIEHCFNPAQAFENMHKLCRKGGVMIHAFPSNCNANHGLYNMQPRLYALIACANGYEILNYSFTVDYKPCLREFSHKSYATYDDRDLMCYVAYRKNNDAAFVHPFDSIFDDKNKLDGYKTAYDINEFRSYIKGTWSNVRPSSLHCVPTHVTTSVSPVKKILKAIHDFTGRYI